MLNAERGDCASVAKIIEQQAALTEQGQQAVRDTSQDSLGGCGGPSNCDNILQLSCSRHQLHGPAGQDRALHRHHQREPRADGDPARGRDTGAGAGNIYDFVHIFGQK